MRWLPHFTFFILHFFCVLGPPTRLESAYAEGRHCRVAERREIDLV